MSEHQTERVQKEHRAERVRVWDAGGFDEELGQQYATRWRRVHPAPGGGHGSLTAATTYGCRCRACEAAGVRHRATAARDARAARHAGVSRQQRLRRERKAERVQVWDGDPGVSATGRAIAPRWRLVHPAPYGGHGSITARSVCGCQCRACLAAEAAAARARYAAQHADDGGNTAKAARLARRVLDGPQARARTPTRGEAAA